jgi:hypothetical protein
MRRTALVGCLLLAACGGRARPPASPLLPPATAEGPARCEVVQHLAQAPIPDTLRWADAFAITAAGDDVFVHVQTPYGDLGHGRLTAGQSEFTLHPGAATGEQPERFIGYEERRGDGLRRFLVRDLHDPRLVLAANEPSALASFPFMSAGPGGWGLIWSMDGRRQQHETLMFARLDTTRRVHAAHPLVSGRLQSGMDIVGTPSGYAIAYAESVGRDYDTRLSVLSLDTEGLVRQRVVLAEGNPAVGPRMAITSHGITVVYHYGSKLVAARLDLDGALQSPARDLGVAGRVTDLVVHRDEPWFVVTRSHCSGCSRGWSCDAPPEAAAFHLAPDGVVSRFELVHGGRQVVLDALADSSLFERIEFNTSLGDFVLGSVGERLLAAWTMRKEGQKTPVLHVAELSCPDPAPQ